jgi:polyisoprenyl-phosphate glycosyltransferase
MRRRQRGEARPTPGNLLSVVIPAHNEEANVATLHAALCTAVGGTLMDVEIIFVDDGSKDRTRQRVAAIQAQDERVRLIALTRNFGHQAALLAGMEAARGDAIVSMDCDLQHPPALIPEMIAAWRSGAAVVETIRDDTLDATWRKRLCSRVFYRFINLLSETPITPGAADFRLIDRKAANDLLRLRDQRLFLRGMIAWLGYPHASLHYVAGVRAAGRSSYSLRRMLSLAVDAVTAFSAKPLRVAFYVGVLATLLTCCYLVLVAYRVARGEVVEGWTSLMLAVLFLGATQLITLGIIGEYIGRIFDQTRGRPRYVTAEERAPQARRLNPPPDSSQPGSQQQVPTPRAEPDEASKLRQSV